MKRLILILTMFVVALCIAGESQAQLLRRRSGGCSSSGGCSTSGSCSVGSSGCNINTSSGCNISRTVPQAVTVAELPPTTVLGNPAIKALFDAAAGADQKDGCDGDTCPLKPTAKAPVKAGPFNVGPVKVGPVHAQQFTVEPLSAFAFCSTPELIPAQSSTAFASFRTGE